MIVKFDEDNFSIKLYRDFVKGKLVGLMEVIPIDELLEVWADRKTENSSEKPNNCEDCIWSVCNYNKAFEDEPTLSKMEQVDKTQPNADQHAQHIESVETMSCQECRHYVGEYECEPARNNVCAYQPKDEPQTERSE